MMKGNLIFRVLFLTLVMCVTGLVGADNAGNGGGAAAIEQVNINVADAETLQRVLTGIGRSRAEAIVAYREANGKFYSAEELTAVKGIGTSTIEKNQSRIVVD
jgi:competence ComEA-like helix-hairpin-helix protein